MFLTKGMGVGGLALCISTLASLSYADSIVDSLTFGFGKRYVAQLDIELGVLLLTGVR